MFDLERFSGSEYRHITSALEQVLANQNVEGRVNFPLNLISDEDYIARIVAGCVLSAHFDLFNNSPQILTLLIHDSDWRVRQWTLQLFNHQFVHLENNWMLLISLVEDEQPEVRLAVIQTMSRVLLDKANGFKLLAKLLNDIDDQVVAETLRVVSAKFATFMEYQQTNPMEWIEKYLACPSEEVQYAAAGIVLRCLPPLLPNGINEVLDRYITHPSKPMRLVLSYCTRHYEVPPELIERTLRQLIDDPDEEVRNNAFYELLQRKYNMLPGAMSLLAELMESEDMELRGRAWVDYQQMTGQTMDWSIFAEPT